MLPYWNTLQGCDSETKGVSAQFGSKNLKSSSSIRPNIDSIRPYRLISYREWPIRNSRFGPDDAHFDPPIIISAAFWIGYTKAERCQEDTDFPTTYRILNNWRNCCDRSKWGTRSQPSGSIGLVPYNLYPYSNNQSMLSDSLNSPVGTPEQPFESKPPSKNQLILPDVAQSTSSNSKTYSIIENPGYLILLVLVVLLSVRLRLCFAEKITHHLIGMLGLGSPQEAKQILFSLQ